MKNYYYNKLTGEAYSNLSDEELEELLEDITLTFEDIEEVKRCPQY